MRSWIRSVPAPNPPRAPVLPPTPLISEQVVARAVRRIENRTTTLQLSHDHPRVERAD